QPLQQNGDNFLEKLRAHKSDIERWHQDVARRWDEEDRQRSQGMMMTSSMNGGGPRNLHKTASDSKLIQNGAPPLVMLAGGGGRRENGIQQAPLTWRNPMMSNGGGGGGGGEGRGERERTVPIQVQLDEGRVLKIPVQNEWRSATLDRNGGGWRQSPERNGGYGRQQQESAGGRQQSATLPRGFTAAAAAVPPPAASTTRWLQQQQERGGRPWSPERDYSPVPQQQPAAAAAAPTAVAPPPPPPPPPPAAAVKRVQQQQPKVQQQQAARPKSPYQPPEAISTGFHEELLSKIPVKAKEWHERTTSPFRPKSPAGELMRPVGGRVKEMNGHGNGHDAMTRSYPGFYDERREQQPQQQHRSTIVSRPESPAARLFSGLEERWKQRERRQEQEEERRWRERKEEERREIEEARRWREEEERRKVEEEERRWRDEQERRYKEEEERRYREEEERRRREEEERREGEERRRYRERSAEPRGILRLRSESPTKNRASGRRVVFNDEDDVVFLSREGSSRGSPAPAAASAAGGGGEAPPHVRAFDDAVGDVVARWTTMGKAIGGDVERATTEAAAIFSSLRSFLWTAAGRAEATAAEFPALLAPLSGAMEKLSSWRDTRRNTPHFNHVSAVAEGIPAIGWVTMVSEMGYGRSGDGLSKFLILFVQKPTPAPFVKEMLDASLFYVNRVLKDNKEHAEWVNTWKEVLTSLHTFVRQTHTTGLVWNSAPGAAPPAGAAAAAAPKAGGAPPPPPGPPPPPPPPPPVDSSSSSSGDKSGRDALFAQLNSGEAVTKGLKKVTADMQTHKNPALRGEGMTPGNVSSAASSASKPAAAAAAAVKPPKTELQNGKQWSVEFHKNNKDIVVTAGDKKQTLYVYKCEGCVIQVKGKLNSVTLDSCKKTDIVVEGVVAQCETINCQSIKIQTLGEMPTVSIQKTDGCQVYLSEAARDAEIVTSKSSEMNVLVPGGPDGDFVEFPVPEQFKTVYKGGKLVTVVSDIC
ncbi:hypothetical protein PFISCL1PPCAC_22469, partial [Pristionchus fissidentatus]